MGKPRALVIALGLAASVLLIACLHVASLLIARSVTREQEVAVRAALGAHRFRLVRQMLTESVLMAAFAGLLGVLLAWWGVQIFSAMRDRSVPWYLGAGSQDPIPWFVQMHVGGRTLLFAAGISLLTCCVFAILPAVGASTVHLSRLLSRGKMLTGGPRFLALRGLLVVADIGIAFVLLIGAGLLVNSHVRVSEIDFGYNPRDVLTAHVPLYDVPAYEKPQEQSVFIETVVRRVRSLPGVRSATAGSSPVRGTGNHGAFQIEGVQSDEPRYRNPDLDDRLPDRSYLWFPLWRIPPDYFRVLQVPVLQGRHFTEQDTAVSQPVAIISEALARRFWPNRSPLGRYVVEAPRDSNAVPVPREIVGIVAIVARLGRTEPTDQEVYIPQSQAGGPDGEMELLVRVDPGRRDIATAVGREILMTDPDVVVRRMAFLEEDIADFFAPQRSFLLYVGSFAVVALTLACMGVYGMTAYAASRRTHEIGIRMALGASRGDVLTAVLRQGVKLTLIGLIVGLAGALAATRVIRSLLYGVSSTDPLTFAGVAALLTAVVLLACYLPARRAARIDPMVALRCE